MIFHSRVVQAVQWCGHCCCRSGIGYSHGRGISVSCRLCIGVLLRLCSCLSIDVLLSLCSRLCIGILLRLCGRLNVKISTCLSRFLVYCRMCPALLFCAGLPACVGVIAALAEEETVCGVVLANAKLGEESANDTDQRENQANP
jgi:hypothetical protein